MMPATNEQQFLLTEYANINYSRDSIKEAISENKPITLTGVIQRAGVLNQNKRIYPRHILEREVDNYMKIVGEDRAVGELDHPNESVVELKNASHIMRKLWWEGDDLYGQVEVLTTPCGKILQSLLESGVRIGISSRGVGSLKKQNENSVVEDDYVLICFDIVCEPSTPGAFLVRENKIVSVSDTLNNFTKADQLNRILNNISYNISKAKN
tara:strand:- start:1553 stop:2185 length:633 start_codon:yes stop_codon:yes gene_type:complete